MELDFSRQLHYFWALMPEMILCVWGMVVLLAGVSGKHKDPETASSGDPSFGGGADLGWLALVGVLLAGMANGWLYGVEEVGRSSMIALDGFRLFANWVFLLAAALAIMISFAYVYRQRLQAGEFYGLILLSTAGMMFMAGARDLIVIFLGLEVMSIAVYALTAFNRRDRKSAEAGLKYFLLGAFATGFFLYGIALVYGATGSTNIFEIGQTVSSGGASSTLLTIGIAFLTIGFGFKVSAVPFHMWTPDVYEGAPAPVTAFMSAAVKAAAFVAFLRVFMVGFDGAYDTWYPIMWWLAALTMVAANLMALVQSNVKRMLAYSSVAHAGYLLVAITASNEAGAAGLLFYLLIYTVMNMGAFAIVIGVAHQAEERLQVEDYAGFGWAQPMMGVLLTVFLLSLAGFPGTGGFMGKIYLLQAAADAQLWYLMVVLVLSTIASYWYYLRVAWFMWMKRQLADDQHDMVIIPVPMRIALIASVAIVIYMGFFPGAALDFARESVEGLASLGGAMPGLGE
ncbi:MAG: NADH-quinone oxidoreductase subunit N [Gemmatimonadota bacterium]|nr:NADH-quinone oxidoreductase subunit N [Gemmatimonadota bacterium]MDE3006450.1 NADH-quinone oxidoreductase subunit N [Gemmatimonadota bacterium]MDE3014059.1 NADH-quinone oxidoreductase subunit N [Gemmatimonadota bacterium]